jgi:pyruvate formate lyase activating enzyme
MEATMTETTAATGLILHLQRLSTEDGPGLRTTVFLKGCPLHCRWCHNPESISPKAEIQWLAVRCIGCDSCVETCPEGALSRNEEGVIRDRELCTVCGACVDACPSGAMEVLGTPTSVEDLVSELLKDSAYFEKSGGGVTFSGGEPTLQPAFTLELARQLKAKSIPLALDTCALCNHQTLEEMFPLFDIFLVDLKLIDPAEHEKWTGAPLEKILLNLKWLAGMVKEHAQEKTLWIRTPLIPAATFTQANLAGISAWLAQNVGDTAARWELCAFNNLCRDKYTRLDMDWHFNQTELMTQTDLDQAATWARSGGFDPARVFVTGAAKLED